jgi:hypothetical protein
LVVGPIIGSGWVRRITSSSIEDLACPNPFEFKLIKLYIQDAICYGLLGEVVSEGTPFDGMSIGAFVRRDDLVTFGDARCSYNLLISRAFPEILGKWPIRNPELLKSSTLPYFRGSAGDIWLKRAEPV